jgi:uncharacterized membrane protein
VLRAGLVAIGVFVLVMGVLVLFLGGEEIYSTNGSAFGLCAGLGSCITVIKSSWGLYAQIIGGLLTALGLAITVYGALKKV